MIRSCFVTNGGAEACKVSGIHPGDANEIGTVMPVLPIRIIVRPSHKEMSSSSLPSSSIPRITPAAMPLAT